MKKMLFILLVLAVAGTGKVCAQDTVKPKKETFIWQKQYMDEAGIPADIQAKIDAVTASYDVKLKEIRKDKTLSEEVKKEKNKELYKQRAEEITALLTKEQKEKIKTIRERLKKENESGQN